MGARFTNTLFSTGYDLNHSAKVLNDYLNKILNGLINEKCNLILQQQVEEVILPRKNIKTDHPIVYFNEAPVAHTTCQKYLGMHLEKN